MKTVEEARQCWCPFARVILDYGEGSAGTQAAVSANRGWADDSDFLNKDSRCIASECMAWRWTQKRNPDWRPTGHMMSTQETHPDDKPSWYIDDKTRGYCGLAGKP